MDQSQTLSLQEREVLSALQEVSTLFLGLGGHSERDIERFLNELSYLEDLVQWRLRAGKESWDTVVYNTVMLRVEKIRTFMNVSVEAREFLDSETIRIECEAQLARFIEDGPKIKIWRSWQDGFRSSFYLTLSKNHLGFLVDWLRKRWPVQMETYEVQTYLPAVAHRLPTKDRVAMFSVVSRIP